MNKFEPKIEKKKTNDHFFWRISFNCMIALVVVAICLFVGMWGYHDIENMNWVDAYVNAAMILSGMGPVTELKTDAGKIFAGSYALFSGIVFLFFMAIFFTPILHRIYHRLHLKEDSKDRF